jgi:hypothetical protein
MERRPAGRSARATPITDSGAHELDFRQQRLRREDREPRRCRLPQLAGADTHSGTDNHSAAEPDPRANVDRMREFRPGRASGSIARIIGGQQLSIRAWLSLPADGDWRRVQKYRAEVHGQFRPECDLRSIVTIEGRLDCGIGARIAEQLAQQRGPTANVGGITGVVTARTGGARAAARRPAPDPSPNTTHRAASCCARSG